MASPVQLALAEHSQALRATSRKFLMVALNVGSPTLPAQSSSPTLLPVENSTNALGGLSPKGSVKGA